MEARTTPRYNLRSLKKGLKYIIVIQRFARKIIRKKMALRMLIKNNEYVKKCKTNKKRDTDSLSSLITRPMSQSDCIKIGIAVEKLFRDIIVQNSHLKDIKQKNKKGLKEKDHLFLDEENKIIYYAEFKSNINLDTEKSVSTSEKCIEISKSLKKKYPDHKIKWCLVGCRYVDKKLIPKKLSDKYGKIKKHLFGINNYLNLLKIKIGFTHTSYCNFLNEMADKMFE